MKELFIIFYVNGSSYFVGADFNAAYFSNEENPIYFETAGAAKERLKEESILFPLQFAGQSFQIIPVIKFN